MRVSTALFLIHLHAHILCEVVPKHQTASCRRSQCQMHCMQIHLHVSKVSFSLGSERSQVGVFNAVSDQTLEQEWCSIQLILEPLHRQKASN